MSWVPLNVHSQYSILDSTASVMDLAQRAKNFGIDSLAITDQGNLYGAIDFYKACKAVGIKPILGCKIWMAPQSRLEKKRIFGSPNGFPIILLAKDIEGYKNLCKLSSLGFLEGFYYQPRIDKELLSELHEGLICLSGSIYGPLGYQVLQGNEEAILAEAKWYQKLFQQDFYLEMQRSPLSDEYTENWLAQKARDFVSFQEKVNQKFLDLSKELDIPLVATNEIHYIEKSDWQAHEILLNIQSGEPCEIWERDSQGNPKNKAPNPKRETKATSEFYFKSPHLMQDLFSDLPQAIEETLKIAEKCNCEIDFHTKLYPVFIPKELETKVMGKEERLKAAEQFLKDLCLKGVGTRYTEEKLAHVQLKYPDKDPLKVVLDRFEYEFEILTSKGMSDYMLIVYDFISWAKENHIPMGPGRGSAAGSIISYLIGITDIEPLRFHLFFERFINPERISYPDIDVDICMDRRQEVIDYVVSKYGKEKVAQIITFGTMKAKMAIRDVGRVLNVALSKVNEIAALVPEDPTMTLKKAFEIDPQFNLLMEKDAEAAAVLEMAKKTEGSIRNTSTHAAGLIISAHPITDHVPVCTAKDSEMVVTQYAMKPVESVGMLKIDFLGLKTLTSIQKCVDAIALSTGRVIEWGSLPLDDQPTFDLLNQGKTLGVFQLESGGMQDLAKQLHIDTFEEIIAVGALYRPGPMDMIPSFIQRKHGREAIEIDHPLMQPILSETYGVMVYQEQVMQIASALAGYTLGEGDVLRRAMGKKDKNEMSRQREKFLKGSKEKGIDTELAGRIFDKIEKFASYGFNKSHAAAYAYLSYATAYFKANYPKEWMAALMTCDLNDTAKVAKFIGESRSLQIDVLPPDINFAGSSFMASPEGIRFAMLGIKGIGHSVVEIILEEKTLRGSYKNLYDFVKRIDKTRIGKKQIEVLCDAGCFDFTLWSRDALRGSVEAMFDQSFQEQKESSLGVLNLFSLIEEPVEPFAKEPSLSVKSTKLQVLQREKELLGFYLTGHPMDSYQKMLSRLSCVPLKDFETLPDKSIFRAVFIIETCQVKISSKSQKKFAILTIGDGLERFDLPIWPELFEQSASFLSENELIYAILYSERKEGSLNLSCRYLDQFTTLDENKVKASDDLYDKLKNQARAPEPKWKKAMKSKPVVVQKEEEIKHLVLGVLVDKLRMTEILALKEIFRAFAGKSTIELQFFSQERCISTLLVDSQWGVQWGVDFQKKIDLFLSQTDSFYSKNLT